MATEGPHSLVWFRRDLRLQDNPALNAALESGLPVVALYIHDPQPKDGWAQGGASRWYLHHSLLALQQELAEIGVPLICQRGDAAEQIKRSLKARGIKKLFFNRVMEPGQVELESDISALMENRGIVGENFHEDSLLPADRVAKRDGSPFKVFTPFWRHASEVLTHEGVEHRLFATPKPCSRPLAADSREVDKLGLLDTQPWHGKLHAYWSPGEDSAQQMLSLFLEERIDAYEVFRDLPAQLGTSKLSAALHFGELSVARLYAVCQGRLAHEADDGVRAAMRRFLAQIGWREFSRHVLTAFPHTPTLSLNRRYEHPGAWEAYGDDHQLKAWQRGETGIPLVDAGMRELWESGWMHNRVRMVVASFLTKNLGIHWLQGARWFWDTLVDADLANNTLGWQWVAGCGTDAAPYYRIFNPQLQAKKFDPEGEYIHRWLGDDGMGNTPLVDLGASRAQALKRYQSTIRKINN
ncbi:MAG: deoxyribodipyrimidine photo-lyase [Candidatus Thiodiazotropha sp.]